MKNDPITKISLFYVDIFKSRTNCYEFYIEKQWDNKLKTCKPPDKTPMELKNPVIVNKLFRGE